MVRLIDDEPLPKSGSRVGGPCWPQGQIVHNFGAPTCQSQSAFFDVLRARRSRSGGPIEPELVGRVLHLAMELREQRNDGRFGFWESRSSPSAGGVHGIGACLIPLSDEDPAGLYSPEDNALIAIPNIPAARSQAIRFLDDLGLPQNGWFVQLIADVPAYSSRYRNSDSLILRDAGALCTIIGLVAEALNGWARILGHLDRGIVRALNLGPNYAGVGGVHLTGCLPDTSSG